MKDMHRSVIGSHDAEGPEYRRAKERTVTPVSWEASYPRQ
jgi:hypothetical protein